MLKTKIVSTSVRTAAWCSTQRNASAMSWRMVGSGGAVAAVRRQHAPEHQHGSERDARCTGRRTVRRGRRAKSAAPDRRPGELVTVMKPVISRALATPRSSRCDQHRHQRRGGVVGEHLGGAEQEHRRAAPADRATSVAIARVSSTSTTARSRSTVTTMTARSSRSAITPANSPNTRGGSHWSSAASATRNASCGHRGDQQRTGRDARPSPRLLTQRGAEQPPELGAETRRQRRSRPRH